LHHPINWKRDFIFRGSQLFYNRIPFNNFAERAVEIPIAFDFLARLQNKNTILEVGNVLSNYENLLSDYLGIRPRRIIDKFETGFGIDNVDLMNLSSIEKYHTIVSISTIEHIGQRVSPTGEFGESNKVADREAPLKAIAKIYDLLYVGGRAFITVPFGKLIDGGWYIQFSSEYLKLLVTKFAVPKESLSVSFLRRTDLELGSVNPHQLWVEAIEKDLSDVAYNSPWIGADAIAVIELTKIPGNFPPNLNAPLTPFVYEYPILFGNIHYYQFITHSAKPNSSGEIHSEKHGFVFQGHYEYLPAGEYELVFSIQVDVPCDLLFEIRIKEKKEGTLQSQINQSTNICWIVKIWSDQSNIEFQLSNCSGNLVNVLVKKLHFRKVRSIMS
jgi:hypothetical protein